MVQGWSSREIGGLPAHHRASRSMSATCVPHSGRISRRQSAQPRDAVKPEPGKDRGNNASRPSRPCRDLWGCVAEEKPALPQPGGAAPRPPCFAILTSIACGRPSAEKHGSKGLLLRWTGPFSKPLAYSGAFKEDYDLRDCAVIDQVGGPGWGWPEPEHTCFWSDRADARLLIPLSNQSDHLIVLGIAEHRLDSPNARIAVFASGSYLATFDFTARMATSEYCLFVPRHIIFGPWVEISLRPQPGIKGCPLRAAE